MLGLFVVVPLTLILIYRVLPPPLTSVMVIRLVEGHSISREWVPLGDIAPVARQAVIASEDNLFCSHRGVDWSALWQAASAEWEGGGKGLGGGASTITMQTARNLMLWPQRSYVRKALELYVATLIDALWPKQRVLEVYLNIAEWGPGVFGIERAARAHFGVGANRLTRAQAARLAAVLPNPRVLDPTATGGYVARQARIIERRIGQLGPLLDCAR